MLGFTLLLCVCVCQATYITYRLHAALVSAVKVMCCIQCSLVIFKQAVTCGATNSAPCCHLANDTDLLDLSAAMDKKCCHQASANEMSNSTGSNLITNKLTFDPPTRLPELTQNVIRSSHGHSAPSLKISCKSVQPLSRNVADKETNKETKKSPENNTPSPDRGRGNNLFTCLNVYIVAYI